MTSNTKDNTVEEIVGELLAKHFLIEGAETELMVKLYPQLVGRIAKELNTLIAKREKEALEGFGKYLAKKQFYESRSNELRLPKLLEKYLKDK